MPSFEAQVSQAIKPDSRWLLVWILLISRPSMASFERSAYRNMYCRCELWLLKLLTLSPPPLNDGRYKTSQALQSFLEPVKDRLGEIDNHRKPQSTYVRVVTRHFREIESQTWRKPVSKRGNIRRSYLNLKAIDPTFRGKPSIDLDCRSRLSECHLAPVLDC